LSYSREWSGDEPGQISGEPDSQQFTFQPATMPWQMDSGTSSVVPPKELGHHTTCKSSYRRCIALLPQVLSRVTFVRHCGEDEGWKVEEFRSDLHAIILAPLTGALCSSLAIDRDTGDLRAFLRDRFLNGGLFGCYNLDISTAANHTVKPSNATLTPFGNEL
jgi:hypothetical protein